MSTVSQAEAAGLIASLAALRGRELIDALVRGPLAGRVAVTASFGAESAVLLDLVAQVDPALPVIFLDTGALFDETIAYRQSLARHLGLTGVIDIVPTAEESRAAEELWTTDSDRCCALRKVAPLARAVEGYAVLIDGRRRSHGFARETMPALSFEQGRIKASPLSDLDDRAIEAAFAARGLPPHPLVADGYRSIGCWPCTRPVAPGEPARAGRWAGAAKTECGIHLPLPASPPASPKGPDSAS
jgi:phosphoadenosine phosphosulfate reductase